MMESRGNARRSPLPSPLTNLRSAAFTNLRAVSLGFWNIVVNLEFNGLGQNRDEAVKVRLISMQLWNMDL